MPLFLEGAASEHLFVSSLFFCSGHIPLMCAHTRPQSQAEAEGHIVNLYTYLAAVSG